MSDFDEHVEDATYEEEPLENVDVPQELPLGDAEQLAYRLLKRAAGIKGVVIDRQAFLRAELAGIYDAETIERAIATSPQEAGVPLDKADGLADAAIALESGRVAGLSALAGIPGGLAAWGTIPADILQYFAHSLRVAQKLAYLYGWDALDLVDGKVDDHGLYQLILLLGTMINVEGVGVELARIAPEATELGFSEALTQLKQQDETWYLPIKKVLGVVGTNVTKGAFAEAVAHGVPVLSGLVSGSMTYITFRFGAVALRKLLRAMPQATGRAAEVEEMEAFATQWEQDTREAYDQALHSAIETAGERAGTFAAQAGEAAGEMGDRASEAAAVFAEQAGAVASAAVDKAAEYAVIARDKATEAAKAAAIGFIRGLGTRKKEKRRRQAEETQPQPSASSAPASSVAQELRTLKELLDEGIITQEEFDAKKRQLLGL